MSGRSNTLSLTFAGKRFRACQSGASAIEFAIVAMPFLALVLGLLELGLIFVTNVMLDSAVAGFATQIRTGQVQAPGTSATNSSGIQMDLSDATQWICSQMVLWSASTCAKQLQLDVRPITSFQQSSSASPISGSQFSSSGLCYYSGNAGNIVEIRAYYLFGMINPLLPGVLPTVKSYQSAQGTASGTFYLIQTAQVFKLENYSGNQNTGAGC